MTPVNNYFKVIERDGLGSVVHHYECFDDKDVPSVNEAVFNCVKARSEQAGACRLVIYRRLSAQIHTKCLGNAVSAAEFIGLRTTTPCNETGLPHKLAEESLVCGMCGRSDT